MKIILFTLVGIGVLLFLFIARPAPIMPAAYSPPKAPALEGVLAPNELLKKSELLALGTIDGPEEVAIDSNGLVYSGTASGKIVRIYPDRKLELFAQTEGRPLGMQFDKQNNLIVCDSSQGLLSINSEGVIQVLADSAEGTPFKFTDALDIAQDGTIYFTDASYKYGTNDYVFDLLEAKPYGRFLSYSPATEQVKVLVKDLYFANGVALSKNEDFVLINETYRYRILRYWLTGPKAGSHEVFADNLPGFPDNISSDGKGSFWLALFTVRNGLLDSVHPLPFLKGLLARLPVALWPKSEAYGLVLQLNENGEITQSLHEPSGAHLKEITSAREYDGYLYLGSLHNDRIGKYRLPQQEIKILDIETLE